MGASKEVKATKDAIASTSPPPAGFGLHCPDASIPLCSENQSFCAVRGWG